MQIDGERSLIFVTHTASPGGAELALARYLRQQKQFTVELITFDDGEIWRGLNNDLVSVTVLAGNVARQLRQLRFRVRQGPHRRVVVANSMRAAFYCAMVLPRSNRLVYWVRDQLSHSSMSRHNLLATRAITLPRVSAFLANSDTTARTIPARSRPVFVVHSPSGVSDSQLSAPIWNHSGAGTPLLFLGRLAPWKGPDLAILAVAELRRRGHDVRLTVAGAAHFDENAFADALPKLATNAGVGPFVRFVGHVDGVDDLLREHAMLLHCSIVPEPFGQVVVQAMANGLVVVAANTGGPAEMISDGVDGLLYTMGDAGALVNAVESVIRMPNRGPLTAAARQKASQFSDEACVREIDDALTEVVGRPAQIHARVR